MAYKAPNQSVFKTGFEPCSEKGVGILWFLLSTISTVRGVISFIVYVCLATSFRTMITPVFLCVLSEALAMNHHLLTYLEKSIT